jgi:hypothetical protein
MHIPRRHLNYANVVATLALVFAMSGGALAAKHYLINSTKQINPKVLKKLKGNTGKTGKTGATGVAGAVGKEGPAGKQGEPGPLLSTIPSGKTLKGDYSLEGVGTVIESGWSFTFPLASTPTAHFIEKGKTPPAQCPGTVSEPAAAPGNLCVYEAQGGGVNRTEAGVNNTETDVIGNGNRLGFGVTIVQSASGSNAWSEGTWAVTAP